MGSYLTIVNDTNQPWYCKEGPDMVALEIVGQIFTLFTGIAGSIANMSGGGALGVKTSGDTTMVSNVAASALAAAGDPTKITAIAEITGQVSKFGEELVTLFKTQFENKGYQLIPPKSEKRYGKFSLSLMQQGECIKMVVQDKKTIVTDKLIMEPIFSGPTDKSNKKYKISSYASDVSIARIVATPKKMHRELGEEETFEYVPMRSLREQEDDSPLLLIHRDGTTELIVDGERRLFEKEGPTNLRQ